MFPTENYLLYGIATVIMPRCTCASEVPYMLDQRPLLYKGRTQIVASLASKMKHLVAALK